MPGLTDFGSIRFKFDQFKISTRMRRMLRSADFRGFFLNRCRSALRSIRVIRVPFSLFHHQFRNLIIHFQEVNPFGKLCEVDIFLIV